MGFRRCGSGCVRDKHSQGSMSWAHAPSMLSEMGVFWGKLLTPLSSISQLGHRFYVSLLSNANKCGLSGALTTWSSVTLR